MKKILAMLLSLLVLPAFAGEDDFLKPVGKPPKGKAQMRQGGQALPPLPLPVTPLRRSEKKRPPSPATLIGKVIWGSHLDYQWPDGKVSRIYDWNMKAGKLWTNETFRKSFGMVNGDVDGLGWKALMIHPDDSGLIIEGLNERIEQKSKMWVKEYRHLKK